MQFSSSRFFHVIIDALCDSVGADRPGAKVPAESDPASPTAQYPHTHGARLDGIELRGPQACAWVAEHLQQPTYVRQGLLIPGLEEPGSTRH